MLTAFLAAKGWLGLKNQWWLLIVFAIATISATAITIAKNRDTAMIDTAKEAGATTAISEGRKTTLDQNRKANDAENDVKRGGNAAYDECVRASRTGSAACDRFRD